MINHMKLLAILRRPKQYIKNFFIFAPLFFIFNFQIEVMTTVAIGFTLFSLIGSSIYILNDYPDIEEDRVHPIKKNRQPASRAVFKKQ